jgi:16S rRNA (guanine527-N7)-methyltransferase
MIGPGDLEMHVRHAAGFVAALEESRGRAVAPGELIVDLGSGGGVPGLVLAALLDGARVNLVEGSTGRATFLNRSVVSCGFEELTLVIGQRAEDVGHDPVWRGQAAAVVARGFGAPSETAECGAPLLELGGVLVVSEPPGSDGSRWDPLGLARLGLGERGVVHAGGFGYAVFEQTSVCPERFPRRVGVPRRRRVF